MEITLEQVERLREKANVSYGQAKQALEYSGGNLLDALIYLEENGVIPRPENACYSTKAQCRPPVEEEISAVPAPPVRPKRRRGLRWFFRRCRSWLVDNELEVWRRGEPITSLPVLILAILLIFAYYITVPLLVGGLFFGFRYRFSGPDLDRELINQSMDTAADTAQDLGRQVMDELRSQHDRHSGPQDQ